MTLEASLIMPMVICVMALLIYFSFYLYSRCIMSQDAYTLAFRAGLAAEETSPEAYVSEHRSAVAGRKYFGSTGVNFEAQVSGKEITVKAGGNTKHGAMGRYFLKPRDGWGYSAEARVRERRYAKHIRRLKRLKDIGNEILDIGE